MTFLDSSKFVDLNVVPERRFSGDWKDWSEKNEGVVGYRVVARFRDMFYGSDSFDYFNLSHFALFADKAQAEALAKRIEAAIHQSGARRLSPQHWLGGDWSEAVLEQTPRK